MTQLFGVSHLGYLYFSVAFLSLYLSFSSSSLLFQIFFLWFALSFGVVALGYFSLFGVTEKIFGKTNKGSLPLISSVFFLPWLLCVKTYWKLACLYHDTFENISDKVHTGLRFSFFILIFFSLSLHFLILCPILYPQGMYVGRRPRHHGEIPSDTKLVVDLTCEFSASPSVANHSDWSYVCCPSFDALMPTDVSVSLKTLTGMLKAEVSE